MGDGVTSTAEGACQADPAANDAVIRFAAAGRALERTLRGLAFAIHLVEPEESLRMEIHDGLLWLAPRGSRPLPTRYERRPSLHIERSAHARRQEPFIS
jgi:hypothetical protein